MALCKSAKTGSPTADAPVSIKNFLDIPPTFSFTVKNINATPSRKKAAPEMEKNHKNKLPLNVGANAARGISILIASTINTTISAQNIGQLNFLFTSSHLLRMFIHPTPLIFSNPPLLSDVSL